MADYYVKVVVGFATTAYLTLLLLIVFYILGEAEIIQGEEIESIVPSPEFSGNGYFSHLRLPKNGPTLSGSCVYKPLLMTLLYIY